MDLAWYLIGPQIHEWWAGSTRGGCFRCLRASWGTRSRDIAGWARLCKRALREFPPREKHLQFWSIFRLKKNRFKWYVKQGRHVIKAGYLLFWLSSGQPDYAEACWWCHSCSWSKNLKTCRNSETSWGICSRQRGSVWLHRLEHISSQRPRFCRRNEVRSWPPFVALLWKWCKIPPRSEQSLQKKGKMMWQKW